MWYIIKYIKLGWRIRESLLNDLKRFRIWPSWKKPGSGRPEETRNPTGAGIRSPGFYRIDNCWEIFISAHPSGVAFIIFRDGPNSKPRRVCSADIEKGIPWSYILQDVFKSSSITGNRAAPSSRHYRDLSGTGYAKFPDTNQVIRCPDIRVKNHTVRVRRPCIILLLLI